MKTTLRFFRSVACAWTGIVHTVKTQRNMRIHAVAAVLALAAAWWLRIPRGDVLLVFFSIALVMSLELVNTAIEAVVDLVTEEWREKAREAKDAAAGAVLIAALLAAVVGLCVFGPPLLARLAGQG